MIPSFIEECIRASEYRQRKAKEKRQQRLDAIAAANEPQTTATLSPAEMAAIARHKKAIDDSLAAYERQQQVVKAREEEERQTKTLQLFREFWEASTPKERGRIALQYAYVRGFVPVTAAGFQNQQQVDKTMAALKDKAFIAQHFPEHLAEWGKIIDGAKA